jgi:hypothetical protein
VTFHFFLFIFKINQSLYWAHVNKQEVFPIYTTCTSNIAKKIKIYPQGLVAMNHQKPKQRAGDFNSPNYLSLLNGKEVSPASPCS